MSFRVELIEIDWSPTPIPDRTIEHAEEFEDFKLKPATVPKALSECNPIILARLGVWTSDIKTFSRNVLPYARANGASHAYSLGNISSQEGFLDSGIGAKGEDIVKKNVPNPAHAFRLQWHRAVLHEKLGDLTLSSEEVDRMTILQSLQTLHDIMRLTANDPNFTGQSQRYPNIMNLVRLSRGDNKRGDNKR